MICGIGTDIVQTERFKKWISKPEMLNRFFNEKEITVSCEEKSEMKIQKLSEHYAARFAAKEAFSKALGTGISGFDLKEVFIVNDELGKPVLMLEGKALESVEKRFGNGCRCHVSLSHEKEYAIAFVVIEN